MVSRNWLMIQEKKDNIYSRKTKPMKKIKRVGVFHYEFDVETGEWISCLDRHDSRVLASRNHWKVLI